jgi:hypothetical protein
MKTLRLFAAIAVGLLSIFSCLYAEESVGGVIIPLSEKLGIVPGDRAMVTVGEKDGIVKGDVGSILLKEAGVDVAIGECAIARRGYQSSVCELTKGRREVERGNTISFPAVQSVDSALFPFVITTLSNILEPYQPYKRLKVSIYGVFDSNNAITALSDSIARELQFVFSQKKRLQMVDRTEMRGVVFYPDSERELIGLAKNQMKKADIDVVIAARYALVDGKIEMTVNKLDRNGYDAVFRFVFPGEAKHAELASRVLLTAQPVSQSDTFPCTVLLKAVPYYPRKDEKSFLVKRESAGSPFVEQGMWRTDFNLIYPVDVKIKVDDEPLEMQGKQQQSVSMTRGLHRIVVSFKRGYFFNESLVFTSEQEVKKEAFLDLSKKHNLMCEVQLTPITEKETITFNLYEVADRERQVIKPIYRAETQKTIERFKD